MKSDVMPSIVKMGPATLKELVKEVKETVAKDLGKARPGRNSIKVVDLWNIHRQARPANSLFRKRII
jgi:hypothetical protein